MKMKLKHSIGIKSFFRRAPLLADGVEVGEVFADHPTSGWRGTISEYRFYANDTGLSLGLPRTAIAQTQREILKLLAFNALPLRERICTPMTVGEAAIAASTVL